MILFEPRRHEPLETSPWDPAAAHAAIRAIVADTEEVLGSGCTWPWHPLDESRRRPPHKSLYLGSVGTLWAMAYLQRERAVDLDLDARDLIGRIHRAYLDEPDTGEVVPSYFLGEVAILLVLWRLDPSTATAGRLHEAIRRNITNPAHEALWAAPGTMIGALHMLEWTGDARWKDLFLENVEYLWGTWQRDETAGCHLWTQDLYGSIVKLIGAAHGFAGNVYPMLRGAALLPPQRREALYDRCAETVKRTAVVDDGLANWPSSAKPSGEPMLVQWCHGAPGIVTALADFPSGRSTEMDTLLLAAGEATWQAGPLSKGHGLCHGTAGNGYAFLKLHSRTGDPAWLERARAFAMHAIGQADSMRRQYGRGRHSLWTGDPGLAVYLWHCMNGSSAMPSLDTLECARGE